MHNRKITPPFLVTYTVFSQKTKKNSLTKVETTEHGHPKRQHIFVAKSQRRGGNFRLNAQMVEDAVNANKVVLRYAQVVALRVQPGKQSGIGQNI